MNLSELNFCRILPSDFRGRGPIQCAWRERPAKPVLRPDDVHLWLANLDQEGWRPDALQHALSEAERARAARFHFERDRNRYIARRAILRQIVGDYLQKTPGEIEFPENSFGKPELAGGALQFNLSTSGEWVLYGFTQRRRTGIDIEKVRPDFDGEEIASRFFHPREANCIGESPTSDRVDAFFAYWTLKEAFVKAHGVGLQRPLLEFDFTPVIRDGRKEFTDTDGSKWLCTTLRPGEPLVGGLVVES